MRSNRFSVVVVLLLLLACGLTAPSFAKDAPTPAEAFAAAAAALPAPSADHAFTFEGQALMNGTSFGTMSFSCKPEKGPNGEAWWLIEEGFDMGGGEMVRSSVATLDQQLRPIRGKVTGKDPDVESFEITWTRSATGFTLKHAVTTDGETTVTEEEVAHEGRTMTTFTALWLFGRQTLPTKGSYEAVVFEPDPDDVDPMFEVGTWTVGEETDWQEQRVLVLKGMKGDDKDVEGFYDPTTKALLGVRLGSRTQGFSMDVVPAKAAQDPAADTGGDLYARPAKNAKEAALQAAMAFGSGNVELLSRVIHWPSIYDGLKAQHEAESAGDPDAEPFPDLATVKASIEAQYTEVLPKNPRGMIEMALKAVEGQLTTKALDGGITRVSFPPLFESLKLDVAERDGAWHLVRLPDGE